jgi:peptidyl-dipeptidase Dcp
MNSPSRSTAALDARAADGAAAQAAGADSASNPLLADWPGEHGLPPFERIDASHFGPALAQALAAHRAELDAIAAQPQPPDFDNTVAAFDRAGALFRRVEPVYSNLAVSESSPALQAVEREWAPKLAAHDNAIYLHAGLFARIDAVWRARAGLAPLERRLVERIHLDFVRAGAGLQGEARARLAAINERLAELTTAFSQAVLADEAEWTLPLPQPAQRQGLPDWLCAALEQAGRERGLTVPAVTLSRSLAMPFLSLSPRRDLREAVWRAWTGRGERLCGARDTRPLIVEILQLRRERARLLGYATHADYMLADRMAATPQAALALMREVWQRALPRAAAERAELRALAAADGITDWAAWDWRYYAERLRRARFALDDAEVKPYFVLERMIEAMFDCARRLYGLQFTELHDFPRYHPSLRCWRVERRAEPGAAPVDVGLFLGDFFARPSKRGGAWMNLYRMQAGPLRPIVVNNCNFAQAPDGQPTLLGFDDVRTLFHEFGHGLHGLLSDVPYQRLACTQVLWDFVELPSQINEHWAEEPQVLARHALHAETGQPMPADLLERVMRARRHGQAYETLQYTASALLDMELHLRDDVAGWSADDVSAFERAAAARLGVPDDIGFIHRLPHFRHLFSGDHYSAGYYVYQWAQVLDADAYAAFTETGDPFDAATARRFLEQVLAAGNSRDPAEAYRAFRGRDARIEPMLARRGLLDEAPQPA